MGTRDTSSICGGQFFMRLVRHFGLCTPHVLSTCTLVIPSMGLLTIHRLITAGILIHRPAIGQEADRIYWVRALRGGEHPPRRGPEVVVDRGRAEAPRGRG